MGVLFRFQFPNELVERYPYFIETGTGLGVSLSYAAEHKFTRLTSFEYDDRLVATARQRFANDDRITIVRGHSGAMLGPHLQTYSPRAGGFLFWLDAHWPGADFFGEPYKVGVDREVSLPLEREFQVIKHSWPFHQGNFILIVDDVRSIMMLDRGASYLFDTFADTHATVIHNYDDGLAVITPIHDGPRPRLIREYDIHQLVKISRRYIDHGHLSGARGFLGAIIGLTDGGIDPPDVGAKMVARGEACRIFAAQEIEGRSPGAASDMFIQAMGADPLCLDYRMDYIYQVLLPVGWRDLALAEAKRTTKIFPDEPRAWLALVEANRRLGKKEAAIAAMAEARKLPQISTVDLLGAQLAADLGEFDESYRLYDKVMSEHPERIGEALVGMGVAFARDGRFHAALAAFDRALTVGPPDVALCRWNRAETLLTLGRYAEGWPDHGRRFELDLKIPGTGGASSRFRRPMLTPDMPPCRVHLQGEQGFGDVIAMARYTTMLRDLGHEVQLEVDQKLVELLTYSLPGVNVVPMALDFPGWLGLEKFGNFDAILPCMCFPAFFGTTTDTVPWNGPYLTAIPAMVTQAAHNMGPKSSPLQVAICWSSGRRDGIWEDEYCSRKSVPKTQIDLLKAAVPGVNWVSFDFPTNMMVRDDTGPTFADSAAILANCDLLITCDTGIAHLGGAMGIPTWIMMHGPAGSWHWMAAEADGGRWAERSPWYPSVRLFRQERPHEWASVIDRISGALKEFL